MLIEDQQGQGGVRSHMRRDVTGADRGLGGHGWEDTRGAAGVPKADKTPPAAAKAQACRVGAWETCSMPTPTPTTTDNGKPPSVALTIISLTFLVPGTTWNYSTAQHSTAHTKQKRRSLVRLILQVVQRIRPSKTLTLNSSSILVLSLFNLNSVTTTTTTKHVFVS